MELKFSKVERKGPITIVTLSRPEVYNALHIDAHFELNRVFDDFAADPEQWVAIVTGAGDKAFCAGNDLKWQAAGGKRVGGRAGGQVGSMRPEGRLEADAGGCAGAAADGRRRAGRRAASCREQSARHLDKAADGQTSHDTRLARPLA